MSFNQKRRLKNSNPFTAQHGTGTMVRSLAGRNRNRVFVVTDCFTDKKGKLFAYLCDGVKYTVAKPKLKSASHLETVRIAAGSVETDEEIIKLLQNQ